MRTFKIILRQILLLVGLASSAQDPNFHIYLCFGQSNMAGAGDIESQDKTGVDSRFLFMKPQDCNSTRQYAGNWYVAIPPLWGCTGGIGPADYFGRTMVSKLPSSVKIGVVVVAIPGCKIELFGKSGYQGYDTYNYVPSKYAGSAYAWLLDLAKKAQAEGVIKGILLHQGESNSGDKDWPAKVKRVYDHLMADLRLQPATTPLLAGELLYQNFGSCCSGHNPIVNRLPTVIPNAHVISANGLPGKDVYHFNSAGVRTFGARYAEKMLSLYSIEPAVQAPFHAFPFQIPGKIEAEEFDFGGEGISFHEGSATGNQGGATIRNEAVDIENCTDTGNGYNLGWATAGEWVEYTVEVANAAEYDLDIRVAANGSGRTLTLAADGMDLADMIHIPNTGGWQNWTTVSVKGIPLKAGKQVLRFTIGETDYVNINYFQFKPTSGVVSSLEEQLSDKELKLFPNPFTEGIHLQSDQAYAYKICTVEGKVLESGTGTGLHCIGSSLHKGLYLLNVEKPGWRKTIKVLKK